MKYSAGQVVVLLDTNQTPAYSANILKVDQEARLYEISYQENGKNGLTTDHVAEDRLTTVTEMVKDAKKL